MSSLLQDVSSNHLGFKGCQCVCDMLQNNSTLLKIDLSDNGLDDRATVSLLEAFKVSHTRSRNEFLREKFSLVVVLAGKGSCCTTEMIIQPSTDRIRTQDHGIALLTTMSARADQMGAQLSIESDEKTIEKEFGSHVTIHLIFIHGKIHSGTKYVKMVKVKL